MFFLFSRLLGGAKWKIGVLTDGLVLAIFEFTSRVTAEKPTTDKIHQKAASDRGQIYARGRGPVGGAGVRGPRKCGGRRFNVHAYTEGGFSRRISGGREPPVDERNLTGRRRSRTTRKSKARWGGKVRRG